MFPWARRAATLLWLAYPLLAMWGLQRLGPRWLAVVVGLALLARTLLPHSARRSLLPAGWLLAGGLALAVLAWAANDAVPLKLYPVAMNAALLAVFGYSLRRPPSAVERIARLARPDLSAQGVAYTRRVTQAWCVFFALNGSVALVITLFCSDSAWAIYNGGIAYGLIGLLFAVEWLVRQRVLGSSPHA